MAVTGRSWGLGQSDAVRATAIPGYRGAPQNSVIGRNASNLLTVFPRYPIFRQAQPDGPKHNAPVRVGPIHDNPHAGPADETSSAKVSQVGAYFLPAQP